MYWAKKKSFISSICVGVLGLFFEEFERIGVKEASMSIRGLGIVTICPTLWRSAKSGLR